MEVSIWDTYVTKSDGAIMHFDIVAPTEIRDERVIYSYGKSYLESKGQGQQQLSATECQFCHIEDATDEMKRAITAKGYYIIEMQNCN